MNPALATVLVESRDLARRRLRARARGAAVRLSGARRRAARPRLAAAARSPRSCSACEGIGEIRLTLPALARLQAQRPRHRLDRAAARALCAGADGRGLDLARLVIVRCKSRRRSAVGLRAGVARARMRRRVRVARPARRARAAPARGRRARRPHLGRAVAASRPARARVRRAVAARAGAREGGLRCAC